MFYVLNYWQNGAILKDSGLCATLRHHFDPLTLRSNHLYHFDPPTLEICIMYFEPPESILCIYV